jgi:histidinol-phosphate aminotransferase
MDLKKLIRINIQELVPYSSARDEFMGEAVLMDANESPYNQPYNRYPDPRQTGLRQKLSELYSLPGRNIFIGNGSDEAIDLLIRIFCEPARDRIIIMEPSYGMYQVCADVNNVAVDFAGLREDFSLDSEKILKEVLPETKIIFLCSPNNPTSNLLAEEEIIRILKGFEGIVVVDEAYIDFCPGQGLLHLLDDYDNLILLRTLSKAWGMAGIRVGLALGDEEVTAYMNKVKYPYNVNILSQEKAIEMLNTTEDKNEWVRLILQEKERLVNAFGSLDFILEVFPSDANFLLVKVEDADALYNYLLKQGVIVRNRSRLPLCHGCLRITIGTNEENTRLLEEMQLWATNINT